jgi:hypothetical protein
MLSAASYPARQLHRPFRRGEGAARALQEGVAGGGQLHAAAGAAQKDGAHHLLELPDLLAQRRLRDVKPPRRPAEVQLLRDGDEVAEVAKLERHEGPSRGFTYRSRTNNVLAVSFPRQ